MSDIFISYSSKDREKAEQLTELLTSAGLSVWIDHSGLDAATSWSAEIVDAISSCNTFIVLLSPHSIESHNVIKEVSLASEKRKKILPLDLEPIILPRELEYQLTGIQRAPMTNIDAIIRALGKLGLEATSAPSITLVKELDGKKSLMILPFEDLSPTSDNAWFADGIVSELITALTNVKSLRMMDAATTKEYKSFKGHLTTFAKEMSIRYFVQGDVRKFGDSIKITARLLDIDTGDYLWQESIKGTMSDVFEIQEQVAEKVVEGLKLLLTSDEKKKLVERGTENTEAYELFLKAIEYFQRQTENGFRLSSRLCTDAISCDPCYADAYQMKAHSLAALYRTYDRNPDLLSQAESLCKEALRLKPDLFITYLPLSTIYMLQGNDVEAETTAHEFIRKAPDNPMSYGTLGMLYTITGRYAKAIAPFEEVIRLMPDFRPALFNLVIACNGANEIEKRTKCALFALPVYERYLKLHPDDESSQQQFAAMLFWSGRTEDAHQAAINLGNSRDGALLYNAAVLLGMLHNKQEALATFRKAIESGYQDIRLLKDFMTEESDEGILSLSGTPEYEEVKRMVEKLEADENAKKTNV